MKKYLFICLALLSIAFVWARDAELANAEKLAIEANATVKWGIDLGRGTGDAEDRHQTHGFKNEQSWKVRFPIIKKGTNTSERKDDQVYGEVILKDIELAVESKHDAKDFKPTGKVDKLEAKFVFYGFYLQVYNKPDFKTNFASVKTPVAYKNSKDYQFESGFDVLYGTKFGYKNDKWLGLDVGVKIGSNNTWEPAKIKETNKEPRHNEVLNRTVTLSSAKTRNDIAPNEKWVNIADDKLVYTYKEGSIAIVPVATYNVYKVYDWKVDVEKEVDDPHHSKYALGIDFSMRPLGDKLGFALQFNTLFNLAKTYGLKVLKDDNGNVRSGAINNDRVYMGFGAKLESKPVKDLTLYLGFDSGWAYKSMDNPNNAASDLFAWEMLFTAGWKWLTGGLYVGSESTPYEGYNQRSADDKRTADMGAYLEFKTEGGADKANNLVKNLDAGVSLNIHHIITRANQKSENKRLLPFAMKVWAGYKIVITDTMWIKPSGEFWGETNHIFASGYKRTAPTEKPYFGIAYKVGVTYSPVEKVEISADWMHGKTKTGDDRMTVITDTANGNEHRGTFVLACKVIY